ncbi:MAG: beta-ketoacyl-[acyl-carrier-protein] synthase family protein [Candidatus Cryptobacteroides sp.]
MKRRVVITGLGIYSCIGQTLEEVSDSLRNGRSGIGIEEIRKEYGYRSPLTGIVPIPQLKRQMDRRQRTCLAEQGLFAYVSTRDALADAGIDDGYLAENEVGIMFGNDSCAKEVIEGYETVKQMKDTTMVGSTSIFRSMNSTVSMNLSTIFKLRGVNLTVSAACASGSHSIGLATILIRDGFQDMIICGGAQEVNHYGMGSFDGISAFSVRTDEPAKASRPFDASRDGLVPSGGSATLILEEYEHAVKRGAKIYAEVVGYGFSSNGGNISQPSDIGSAIAMQRALEDACMVPEDIQYINAHATSTVQGDAMEALAIKKVFGLGGVPVSSTKSMTGHECWMSGASEILYTILMMKGGFIAPNINFERPDEYSEGLNIISRTLERRLDICLSNSFGFGGTNSALIIKNL